MGRLLGALLVVATSTALGFEKASKLSKRVKALNCIDKCLCELSDRIREGIGERSEVIDRCFSNCTTVNVTEEKITVDRTALGEEAAAVLTELFDYLGSSDCETEYRRIEFCRNRIIRLAEEADRQEKQRSKIWRVAGFSGGIVLCLLLM